MQKELAILRELEICRQHKPKKIASRHGIHQYTVYRIWRRRAETMALLREGEQ